MSEPTVKNCLYCGAEFTTTRLWTSYCPGTDHQKRMWLDANRAASATIKAAAAKSQP